MNNNLVICHLDDGARLNMELTAGTGKGYVAAASNRLRAGGEANDARAVPQGAALSF
jgi:DNA-directed RNA polymerase alpha subunit